MTSLEDGAAFYLPFAKMMGYSGWLEKMPGYEGFSAVGLLGEIQMATLYVFGLEDLARSYSWFYFVPVFFLLFDYSKKFELTQEGLIVLLVSVFSSGCIFYITGGGKIDLISAAIGLLGIYILFFEKSVLLAAFLLAFASVAKISLLIPFFPLVIVGIICQFCYVDFKPKGKFKFFIKALGIFFIAYCFAFAPQFVKNYVFFKNVLAPFYGGKISWETSWYSADTTLRIILTYPLVWFYGSYWAQLGTLSLPIFTFFPFYLKKKILSYKNWKNTEFLLIALTLGMLLWLVLRPSFVAPRYILAILLCFAPFAAKGFDHLIQNNFNNHIKKKIILSFILLWSVFSLIKVIEGRAILNAYAYATNSIDHCQRDSHHCYVVEELNKIAPIGSRILQLSYFTYWFREDLIQVMKKTDEIEFPVMPLTEEVWRLVYEHDFSYLYIDTISHSDYIKTYFLNNLPAWVRLEKIAQIENVIAFKIIFSPSLDFKKKWKVKSEGKHWFVEKEKQNI